MVLDSRENIVVQLSLEWASKVVPKGILFEIPHHVFFFCRSQIPDVLLNSYDLQPQSLVNFQILHKNCSVLLIKQILMIQLHIFIIACI